MKIFYFLLLNLFYAKRLVIVDCDAGIDDIYAIKFLMNEEDVEILAVTTVDGQLAVKCFDCQISGKLAVKINKY